MADEWWLSLGDRRQWTQDQCKHCLLEIRSPEGGAHSWVHAEGLQCGKGTCALNPYGFHAEPLGAPCGDHPANPCNGARGIAPTECPICRHQPHNGQRCRWPLTEDQRDIVDGVIFTRTVHVGECACGSVDELLSDPDMAALAEPFVPSEDPADHFYVLDITDEWVCANDGLNPCPVIDPEVEP